MEAELFHVGGFIVLQEEEVEMVHSGQISNLMPHILLPSTADLTQYNLQHILSANLFALCRKPLEESWHVPGTVCGYGGKRA